MKWLVGLFFLAGVCPATDDWIPVEDMGVKALMASASNGKLVLISSVFKPKLTLFDFSKGKALPIDDGRFRQHLAHLMAYNDGFAVIGPLLKIVYIMDGQGQFVAQIPLGSFKGWQAVFKLEKLSPFGHHQALLSILVPGDKTQLLALLNMDTQTVEILSNREKDEAFSEYWTSDGINIFSYVTHTGRINLIDPKTFRVSKTIRPARDPVERPHRPGRSAYRSRLEPPNQVNQINYFPWQNWGVVEIRTEPKNSCLVLSLAGIQESDVLVYGTFEDQWLVLDRDEYTFLLQDKPKFKPAK